VGGQIGMGQLIDALRRLQVFQPMHAEVAQLRAVRQRVANQFLCRLRYQHLSAMGGGAQAGDPVEWCPEIVAVSLLRRAGLERDTHTQRPGFRPDNATQGSLYRDGGSHGIRRRLECSAESIAEPLEDVAVMLYNSDLERRIMQRKRSMHRLRVFFPEP